MAELRDGNTDEVNQAPSWYFVALAAKGFLSHLFGRTCMMDGLREADWLDEREDPLELQRRPLEKEVVGWLNMQRLASGILIPANPIFQMDQTTASPGGVVEDRVAPTLLSIGCRPPSASSGWVGIGGGAAMHQPPSYARQIRCERLDIRLELVEFCQLSSQGLAGTVMVVVMVGRTGRA
ncbi:hypothetical protein BKA60DRAFT_546008 [Fusarium oxysporum]|nr:hypothetical protein BKA60DRAFT_546008 [Fusarium oxysporum]